MLNLHSTDEETETQRDNIPKVAQLASGGMEPVLLINILSVTEMRILRHRKWFFFGDHGYINASALATLSQLTLPTTNWQGVGDHSNTRCQHHFPSSWKREADSNTTFVS